jgi:hypothetical protein
MKGAINLALEKLTKQSSAGVLDIYRVLGLEKLYRLGLTDILSLRSVARKISLEAAEKFKDSDVPLFSLVACAREAFPCAPNCVADDGSVVDNAGTLPSGVRPIETVDGISMIRSKLSAVVSA